MGKRLLLLRIWDKVDRSDRDGCWLWRGSRNKAGYGLVQYQGRQTTASRAIWMLLHGDISSNQIFVCHHCDNPPCVRPDHLFLGTGSDNLRDAAKKGRLNSQRHPEYRRIPQKLTEEKVREIRMRCSTGSTMSGVAREYGVRLYTVQQIISRHIWGWLGAD